MIAALSEWGAGRLASPAPTLDPQRRADLRQQLVAATPRLTRESGRKSAAQPVSSLLLTGGRHSRATAGGWLPRPVTHSLAAVAVLVMALGAVTFLARSALPGDALYGLKRTTERLDVRLASDTVDRGHIYLLHASIRADEVTALLANPTATTLGPDLDGVSETTGDAVPDTDELTASQTERLVQALHDSDSETVAGVATLTRTAVDSGNPGPLAVVRGWAPDQIRQLNTVATRLPAGPAQQAAVTAAGTVRAAFLRAGELANQLTAGVRCSARGQDALGPLPCPSPGGSGVSAAAAPGVPPVTTPAVPGAGTAAGTVNNPGAATATPGSGGSTGSAPATTSSPRSQPPAGSNGSAAPAPRGGGSSPSSPVGIQPAPATGGSVVSTTPTPLPVPCSVSVGPLGLAVPCTP